MERTALVIMAAGMGSRFGSGIKQLERVGPSGEIIMDYSVHDALEAGFDRIVFIIRKDIEEPFREIIGKRMEEMADVSYVFQSLDDLPAGHVPPADRTKPWGTGQAVLAARDVIREPFAVINADDYYGKEAFVRLHTYLAEAHQTKEGVHDISMVAFRLGNTLSDNGGVTRGICHLDADGHLTGISETKNIIRTPEGAAVEAEQGSCPVDVDAMVSMNMWGMQPDFIAELENGFADFLGREENRASGEYLLPIYIDELLQKKRAEVTVLQSGDTWFGVTFQEDRDYVKDAFRDLVARGIYPQSIYGEV